MNSKYSQLVFVDVEARGTSPVKGTMTEFGAVHYDTRETFHGVIYKSEPDPSNPAIPLIGEQVSTPIEVAIKFDMWLKTHVSSRAVMVSDNPAYDFMWIAGLFDSADMENPFGHSGRRIADYYAGLTNKWSNTQNWKCLRKTVHDHNPVNDAMGNVEAFERIEAGEL